MSPTCDPLSTYFSSPDFLQLSLRFISILSTPIFFLGNYCILFKTPSQMNSIKWFMLSLHLIINVFFYSISVLTIPYLLLPEIAGVIYGDAPLIGLPMSISAMIPLIALALIFMAILSVHENRFFILCEFGFREKWKFWRRFWWAAHYIAAFAFQIPIYFLIPNQETAKLILFKNLPCLPESIHNSPRTFVLATDISYHHCYVLTLVTVQVTEIAFYVLQIISSTRRQSSRMSTKTYQMQKQFFKGLGIQMLVSTILIAFPIVYIYFVVVLSYYNQVATNFSVIGLTMFGPVFTISMLIVHKPYRLAIKGLISREDNKPRSTIASVGVA